MTENDITAMLDKLRQSNATDSVSATEANKANAQHAIAFLLNEIRLNMKPGINLKINDAVLSGDLSKITGNQQRSFTLRLRRILKRIRTSFGF